MSSPVPPAALISSQRGATQAHVRQALNGTLRGIRAAATVGTDPGHPEARARAVTTGRPTAAAPSDADRLHWLDAEAEQLRQVFHAARGAWLAAIKLPLDAVNERHVAWVAMNAAALDYALAGDFVVLAGRLGNAVG